MFVFRCERFPAGTAHIRTASGAVVDFRDGQATVDDAELAEQLCQVPAVFRIVQVSGPEPEAELVKPPARAVRGRGRKPSGR